MHLTNTEHETSNTTNILLGRNTQVSRSVRVFAKTFWNFYLLFQKYENILEVMSASKGNSDRYVAMSMHTNAIGGAGVLSVCFPSCVFDGSSSRWSDSLDGSGRRTLLRHFRPDQKRTRKPKPSKRRGSLTHQGGDSIEQNLVWVSAWKTDWDSVFILRHV